MAGALFRINPQAARPGQQKEAREVKGERLLILYQMGEAASLSVCVLPQMDLTPPKKRRSATHTTQIYGFPSGKCFCLPRLDQFRRVTFLHSALARSLANPLWNKNKTLLGMWLMMNANHLSILTCLATAEGFAEMERKHDKVNGKSWQLLFQDVQIPTCVTYNRGKKLKIYCF